MSGETVLTGRAALSAALGDLEDQLLELELWLEAINEPDHPPAWVFPMMRMHRRLKARYERASTAFHAMPGAAS